MSSAFSWFAELLQRQSVPLVIAFLILFPVLTYSLSTSFFYRKRNSNAPGRFPPTIPYLIPGLYHAVGLLSRPATYFGKWMNEYANHDPFFVKAGRISFVVIRDPKHIETILASDQMTTVFERAEVFDKVFGAPRATLDSYNGFRTSEDTTQVNHAHFGLPQKYLTGSSLLSLAELYISAFRRNMSNKMLQLDSWTQIEDLWSFLEIEITRATNETLFGAALMKEYPKINQDFWKLQANVEQFLPGLPRFTVSGIYDVRDRILAGLKKWLQATHGGTDFARIDTDDPEWDERRGSKYFQERDQVFTKMYSFNYQARAAEALGMMQSSLGTTMPSSFWCIVEVLRNPTLVRYLNSELARYYNPQLGNYNIDAVLKEPIVQSLLAEIGRLRTATRTIKTVRGGNFRLDNSWALPNKTSAIMFSQDIGLNSAEWTKARPHTTTRPLERFWAERFLVPDQQPSARRNKRRGVEIATGTFSMAGLESLNISLGGGSTSRPAQSFANMIQASTLSILLTEFEMQLCDADDVEQVLPTVREVAYGTVKPMDKVAIRIRKRRPGERSN